MKSRVWIAVALLVCASPIHAGVYNLDERYPQVTADKVRGVVLMVRSAALPSPKDGLRPEHFKYQVQAEVSRLEAVQRDGVFSTLDRVGLSACYMRLGERVPEALRILQAGDKDHFLIQSNLAAAYFLSGELTMAVRHQERALALWPEVFAPWDDGQRQRYRACELALLRLYRSRAEESRRGPARDGLDIDPVFPGVRYVGASGEYEPGSLVQEMQDRLPVSSIDILTQIAVWFPTDMRIYWQLGQLLGVAGFIEPSARIAMELAEAGMGRSFRGLPGQRRALLDALKVAKVMLDPTEPTPRGLLAASMMMLSRPMFAPPGIGDAAYAAGCAATVPAMIEFSKPPIPSFQVGGPTEGATADQVFNFRHVAIGFGLGFLVAALCGLQLNEWRRRRQHARSLKSYTNQPDQEGQGNGQFQGGDGAAGAPAASADRPPGTYRLP